VTTQGSEQGNVAATGDVAISRASQVVTIATEVPVAELASRVAALAATARSAVVTVRGDVNQVTQAMQAMSAAMHVASAVITLRGDAAAGGSAASMRGDTPAG
jgi:biopolymer transport protein ExbD